jgi:hypothetical protein
VYGNKIGLKNQLSMILLKYSTTIAGYDKNTTVIGEQPPRPGSLPEKAKEGATYETKMMRNL